MGLLDHLNNITYQKKFWDELDDKDKKSFNYYMINRFLSMEFDYIEVINYLQKYSSVLSNKDIYNLYVSFFPKKKVYNKYIKKLKVSKHDDVIYKVVQDRFDVSKKNVDEYIEILKSYPDVLFTMIVRSGIDEKKASKIVKKL